MSYVALYRKFRPRTFDEVKGQDTVITALKNEVITGRVGHAYLFTGTRGTGKTSTAKIFAKAVNCEHPVNGSPCNECRSCRAVDEQTSLNVVEIDAASNNGVANVRDIIDEVRYAPAEGKYRVYIIDEVHMLSTGAFNALLKTLEEPPSYVIFILATTEVHKIPVTILSRCQRYDFRRITIDTIALQMKSLAAEENLDVTDDALRYIAKTADGSMRDALSLLDQVCAFYTGSSIDLEKTIECLGAVDRSVYEEMTRALAACDAAGCIRVIDHISDLGRDPGQFLTEFIWHLRNVLVSKEFTDPGSFLDVSAEEAAELKEEAGLMDDAFIMHAIRVLSRTLADIKYSSQKRVLLEICFIKLCRPEMEGDHSDSGLEARISAAEKRIEFLEENGVSVPEAGRTESPAGGGASPESREVSEDPGELKEKKKAELREALPEDIKKIAGNWGKMISGMDQPYGKIIEKFVTPRVSEEGRLVLFVPDDTARKALLKSDARALKCLENVISESTGVQMDITADMIRTGRERPEDAGDLPFLDILADPGDVTVSD